MFYNFKPIFHALCMKMQITEKEGITLLIIQKYKII